MDVVIVGGHGQIAMRLAKLLADRGDRVRGVIRNPDHAADLEAVGAEGVVCDIPVTITVANVASRCDGRASAHLTPAPAGRVRAHLTPPAAAGRS